MGGLSQSMESRINLLPPVSRHKVGAREERRTDKAQDNMETNSNREREEKSGGVYGRPR